MTGPAADPGRPGDSDTAPEWRVCANCSIPLGAEEFDALNCADCVERYAIDAWENKRQPAPSVPPQPTVPRAPPP